MARPEADPVAPVARSGAGRPLMTALLVSAIVTLASYGLPDAWAGTAVGAIFLVATYILTLHGRGDEMARRYGLALGGVFETRRIEPGRVLSHLGRAVGWAAIPILIFFPPFWLGYLHWWQPSGPFLHALPPEFGGWALGQLLGIALPEEAFFRGYLQTELDTSWKPRWTLLGARLGPGFLVASLVFALGHVATVAHPNRLAVIFPSLLFGYLRTRTGGIGASVLFHAACNLFASYLGHSYGLLG